MTVGELLNLLDRVPDDATIMVADEDMEGEIVGVEYDEVENVVRLIEDNSSEDYVSEEFDFKDGEEDGEVF